MTLGRVSLSWFFPRDASSKVRGRLRGMAGRHYYHVYNPAAALHNGSLRQVIEDDFAKIPQVLGKIRERDPVAAAAEPSAEQGTLF